MNSNHKAFSCSKLFSSAKQKKAKLNVGSLLLKATLIFGVFSFEAASSELTRQAIEQNYREREKVTEKVEPLTHQFAGEKIDYFSGNVVFQMTDIDIPGNSSIPVNFTRKLRPQITAVDSGVAKQSYLLGDWEMIVPKVTARLPRRVEGLFKCGLNKPPSLTDDLFERYAIPMTYFDGISLTDVNGNIEKIYNAEAYATPSWVPGSSIYYSKERFTFECQGDSFVGKSPDGFKYTFDQAHTDIAPRATRDIQLPGGERETIELSTVYESFLVSKIEDRFGNYVDYTYEPYGSQNSKKRLKTITSSDGRSISFQYSSNTDLLESAQANGRTWNYSYNNGLLNSVELPNKQTWNYQGDLYFRLPKNVDVPRDPAVAPRTFSVTHPSGAEAEFTFKSGWLHRLGYNYAFRACSKKINGSVQQCRAVVDSTCYSLSCKSRVQTIALAKKKVGDYIWDFEIENFNEKFPNHYTSEYSNAEVDMSKITQYVKVTGPKSVEKKVFNRFKGPQEGELLEEYIYDKTNTNTFLKKVNYSYASEDSRYQDILCIVGGASTYNCSTLTTKRNRKSEKTQLFDGEDYLIEYGKYNLYGALEESKQTSHDGKTISIKKEYQHDEISWVLNLPKSTSVSQGEGSFEQIKKIEYKAFSNANQQLLPWKAYEFGALVKIYSSYTSLGNVSKVEFNQLRTSGDGNRFINYSSYYRGKPTLITIPHPSESGNISMTQSFNQDGLLESIEDFNKVKTNYTYDEIGRLASIDLTNDSSYGNWQDTQFVWDDTTNTRTIKRCTLNADRTACTDEVSFETVENYDSLLRLKSTTLNDKVNNITRYQNFAYDYRNLATFTSQVSDSPTESKGVTTVYDALGRKEKVSTSGLGFVTYEYLSGNRIRVTDAGKNTSNDKDSTTTTYQAFGSPSYDVATKIESPEGVTTDINVDIFGLVHSITQSGHGKSVTETRKYDANKQLCLIQRPDVGNTLLKHNALGDVVWQKQGVTNTDCVTTKPTNSTTLAYDNLGATKSITYPDLTPNVTYSYDNNGNLLSIKSGDVEHVYNYNNQNLLEDELLYIDSNNALSIDYEYNALQHRKSITYPDGTYVNFAPNGFGEATQAIYKVGSREHQVFAKDAVYYPSGQINSFTYGNGVTHKTELDPTSLLPTSITDMRNSTNLVNLSYTYDNNRNVTSITNGVQSTYSLSDLAYDGLDRLISTTGGAGIGNSSITYDAIGNIETYTSKGRNLTYTYEESTNRLTSVSGITDKYSSIKYDSRGNVTNNGSFDLSYNLANQMKSANGNSYLYDGHNRRVKKTNSDGHAEYSMYSKDGTLLYREKGGTSGYGTNYIYLGKKLIAKYGEAVQQRAESPQHYRPFGEAINNPNDDAGYTGHKFDKDINLSYMQARYYDPVIGRFYSNDPIGFRDVHSFNRYTYANNNPYKYIDPDGMMSIDLTGGQQINCWILCSRQSHPFSLDAESQEDLKNDIGTVYRALTIDQRKQLEQGRGIYARNRGGTVTPEEHVGGGSAFANMSQWISSTTQMSITDNFNSNNGVIAIDLNKVTTEIVSFNSIGTVWYNTYDRYEKLAYYRSFFAKEVLIKGHIPPEAITLIYDGKR